MKAKPYRIEISNDAEVDFDKSYEYYFQKHPKVADAFFKIINLGIENIKQNPNSYPIAHADLRKYTITKFPFTIYYRIKDSVIQIIAIFHNSRNPEIWNKRI